MRSYTRTIEKWILSLFMICLMVGAGMTDVYAAGYNDPVKISIPYTHIYEADGNRTNDTFNYTVTPLDGSPAPSGSTNGVYTFSVKGVPGGSAQNGQVELSIKFDRPGEYKYKVESAQKGTSDGFTYENRTYTVNVYVQNDSNGGLTAPQALVTAVGNDGKKNQRLELKPSHASEIIPGKQARPTTTPRGDGAGPAAVNTNGQPVAGAPVEETAIEDEPTPLENIVNKVVPKANPDRHYWALVNLISAILTVLVSGIMAYRYFERIDTEEDEYIIRRKGNLRLVGIVLSIIAVAVFLLTEDLSNPMGFIDEWTPLMLGILAITLVMAFVAHKKYGDEEAESEGAAA